MHRASTVGVTTGVAIGSSGLFNPAGKLPRRQTEPKLAGTNAIREQRDLRPVRRCQQDAVADGREHLDCLGQRQLDFAMRGGGYAFWSLAAIFSGFYFVPMIRVSSPSPTPATPWQTSQRRNSLKIDAAPGEVTNIRARLD